VIVFYEGGRLIGLDLWVGVEAVEEVMDGGPVGEREGGEL
jgi:hypothetical protein